MQIFFGKYTIPFKTYSSSQLGFDDHFTEDVKIRVVQDCAHFFFIPCFGMGKDYFYRQEGKYHPLPHDLILRLQAQRNIRTPVFAYALPLLLLLVIGGLFVKGMVHRGQRNSYVKKEFAANLEKTEHALDHLGTHHVIKLDNPSEYGSLSTYLQVFYVSKDSIDCWALKAYDHEVADPKDLARAFQNPKHELPMVQIAKKDLSDAVSRNASRYIKGYRPAVQLLKDGNPYYVESILYLD